MKKLLIWTQSKENLLLEKLKEFKEFNYHQEKSKEKHMSNLLYKEKMFNYKLFKENKERLN